MNAQPDPNLAGKQKILEVYLGASVHNSQEFFEKLQSVPYSRYRELAREDPDFGNACTVVQTLKSGRELGDEESFPIYALYPQLPVHYKEIIDRSLSDGTFAPYLPKQTKQKKPLDPNTVRLREDTKIRKL